MARRLSKIRGRAIVGRRIASMHIDWGRMTESANRQRPLLLVLGLLYAAGIIYGSLIPFQLRDLTWGDAWAGFWAMPFLDLGAASRADWVANLLLYVPLSFLLLGAAWTPDRRGPQAFATSAVLVCCLALAVAIEYVQQFFAPRTVSQNDLIAEALGASLGILIWWGFGVRLVAMACDVIRSGPDAIDAAFRLYGLALIVLSLFPFDFVITGSELDGRLTNLAPWHIAGFDRSFLHGLVDLAAPALAYAPLGALAALRRKGASLGGAVMLGLGLSASLEIAQIFVFSAVTSVATVIAAAAGTGGGLLVVRFASRMPARHIRQWLRAGAAVVALPYIAALLVLNDVRPSRLLAPIGIMDALSEVSFVPFYYHYFTTEVLAMASLLSRVAMYAPVGVLLWAWRGAGWAQPGALASALLAAFLAAGMEAGRLATGLRPDPTNILIAAAAAASAFSFLRLAVRWVENSAPRPSALRPRPAGGGIGQVADNTDSAVPATAKPTRPTAAQVGGPTPTRLPNGGLGRWTGFDHGPGLSGWRLIVAVGLLACVAAALLRFPIHAGWLALALGGYGCLLWFRPLSWLAGLPVAIAAFDFAPYSGWFFLDEFDFFVLVTLAVLVVRQRPSSHDFAPLTWTTGVAIAALILSHAIGVNAFDLLRQPITDNSFNTYYSPFNALRVVKGFAWALLLLPFLAHALGRDGDAAFRWLAVGMLSGLAVAGVSALVERSTFIDPLDFDAGFRVTAGFSSMHIGGGHLAGYLLMAMPFLATLAGTRPGRLRVLVGLGLFTLSSYALLVTFQRTAYAAFVVAFVVLAVGLLLPWRTGPARNGLVVLRLGSAAAIAGVLLALVLGGQMINARFATLGTDLLVRENNWRQGLAMRDPGLPSRLFGEGIGSYPLLYVLRNVDGVTPTTFAVMADGSDRFLRLGSGENQYFEQRVAVRPGDDYTLGIDLRSSGGGRLVILLCEKSLLYSFQCQSATAEATASESWEGFAWDLTIAAHSRTGGWPWLPAPPHTLALIVSDDGAVIDIDNIRLVDRAEHNHVANGDFSAGTNRWFFSGDNHLIWRIHNQFLAILFEQGWFGLLAFLFAVAVAMGRLLRRSASGDQRAPILLAALAGFLTIGMTENLLEAPRLGFLFYLLLFAGLLLVAREKAVDDRSPEQIATRSGRSATRSRRVNLL